VRDFNTPLDLRDVLDLWTMHNPASSVAAVNALKVGELHWMLGIEVRRDQAGGAVHLSHCSYIDSILRRYGFDDVKPVSTPFDSQVRLTLEQAPADVAEFAAMRDVPYREGIGELSSTGWRSPHVRYRVRSIQRG
jgi:hypothetical protein